LLYPRGYAILKMQLIKNMQNISPNQLNEVIQNRDETIMFVDVCTPSEYDEMHIPGAINIPLNELPAKLSSFEGKSKVYINCLSGGRSSNAVEFLNQQNLPTEFINLQGGILSWINAGLPFVSSQN